MTALFGAVQAGNQALLEALIERKCDIELHTQRGETPLMWAAKCQQLQCVQVLINAGAKIHRQDENGQKALDHAEGTLNSHVVEVLREADSKQPEPLSPH
jgi:ankyrin repeat protein